jgi:dihydropyrimidinase
MILLFSEGVMKNKISINKLVEVACTNPAKVYGMYPKKGIIEPGADGDLVIIDADAKQTLTHKMMHGAVDYTSYEGTDLHGKIDLVMQRGNIIAENNEFKGNRGDGKYLYRKPFLGDL